MTLKVPKGLQTDFAFKADGTPLRNKFPYPVRDALQYESTGHIPLTQEPYMIFGDIGVPCNCPLFSEYFFACNKLYVALHKLTVALSAKLDTDKAKFFSEAAIMFKSLPSFPWPVPEGCVYPTFFDNSVKISAALQSAALYYFGDNKTQVAKLDEIIACTEAAEEFKCFSPDFLSDSKYILLSTRACSEAERCFKMCQSDPTQENVASFVKNGASAVFLREKIGKPPRDLIQKIDELLETLTKYHADAYQAFLKSCAT